MCRKGFSPPAAGAEHDDVSFNMEPWYMLYQGRVVTLKPMQLMMHLNGKQ